MKILLVDDEPALRELLRATFEGADVSVDEAESGLEAEARIRRRRPDVIVLDLRMPGMDGVELCKRLKADPRTSCSSTRGICSTCSRSSVASARCFNSRTSRP